MGLDKIFKLKVAATKKDMESGNNSDEDVNKGRREFLVDAVKLVGAAAVVGGMPDVSLAKSVKLKNVVENNHEKVVNIFNRTIEMLGMAGQFVLEGKRINLSVIKSSLETLGTNYGEKYSDYGDLLYKVATEYLEFSVDQASEMIGNSENILKAIDEGRTFFEEHVNNLENLKIGHIISFDKVIEMARLYSLSNKGGAKSEYGVGFTKAIDNNSDKMVQITESSQGTEEMVMLNIANELGADADEYEKYSLHTHPNEFSFFLLGVI